MAKKITVSDIGKKHLKIIGYLVFSNGLGYVIATYIAKDPLLTAIFGPALNYLAYAIEKELKGEGYVKALRK